MWLLSVVVLCLTLSIVLGANTTSSTHNTTSTRSSTSRTSNSSTSASTSTFTFVTVITSTVSPTITKTVRVYNTASSRTSNATTTISASIPSNTPAPCFLNCAQAAAIKNECVTSTNTSCICTSAQFQDDVSSCVVFYCVDQLPFALTLRNETCGKVSPSGEAVSTLFTQTDVGPLTVTSTLTPSGSLTSSANTTTSPSAAERYGCSIVLTALTVSLVAVVGL